jgi:hypothetical protein
VEVSEVQRVVALIVKPQRRRDVDTGTALPIIAPRLLALIDCRALTLYHLQRLSPRIQMTIIAPESAKLGGRSTAA